MLILSRKQGERVLIDGGRVAVEVIEIRSHQVRLAFHAAADIAIDREEVHASKLAESDRSGQVFSD
jgi:carbon storage regulator